MLAGCGENNDNLPVQTASEKWEAVIYFSSSLPLSLVVEKMPSDLEVAYFESEFTFDGEPIIDFLFFDDLGEISIKTLEEEFLLRREQSFLVAQKHLMHAASLDERTSYYPTVDAFVAYGERTDWQNVNLIAVKVFGETAKINSIREFMDVDQIIFKPTFEFQSTGGNNNVDSIEFYAATASNYEKWSPDKGNTTAEALSNNERYIYHNMYWGNVDGFTNNKAYEHEFFFYNYDHLAYLTEAVDQFPACHPALSYTQTNWPASSYPYLDTRLSGSLYYCEWQELEFTAGMAKASSLKATKWYWVYMIGAKGTADLDQFKLQARLNVRDPSDCTNEWCTWSYDYHTLVPSWNCNIPGVTEWTD